MTTSYMESKPKIKINTVNRYVNLYKMLNFAV